jgi:hypothetical protein
MCSSTSLNSLKLIEVNKKLKLAKKIKDINQSFSEEQAIQIANFLMALSEVYYEVETKSKQENKVA